MARCSDDYTAMWRWEWFCRATWRTTFRERKRHSPLAFVELLKERGLEEGPVLDCSCGLGLKTIVMKEAGANVCGSDCCALAIEHARDLTAEEGHSDISYFIAAWEELPRRSEVRYAAIFNDALSWIHSDRAMATSLKGLHGALAPQGVLVYMGALPGTDTDEAKLLEGEWQKRVSEGPHQLGISGSDGTTSVREIVSHERGPDYIDEHHMYLVELDGVCRLESTCVRQSHKWCWPRIRPFLESAGFRDFGSKGFVAANGGVVQLVWAARD